MRGLKTRGFALSSGAIPVIISFVVWMRQTLKENYLLWEMRKIDIFSHPSTRTTKWSPIRLILVTYQPETSWVISTRAKHKPETLTEGPQTVIVVFAMRSGPFYMSRLLALLNHCAGHSWNTAPLNEGRVKKKTRPYWRISNVSNAYQEHIGLKENKIVRTVF